MLDKADEAFVETTWLDVAESWQAMAELIPQMHSERCQIILECIFSDAKVNKGPGMEFYKGVPSNATSRRTTSE